MSGTVKNIIFVGFMGTGKTTLGRLLAERLQWPFIDCDEKIVQKAGMSIADYFAMHGEAAFRDLETEVIREVLSGRMQVVSTGGGSVLRESNRALMKNGGLVIALTADKDTILQRVRHDSGRPLLQGDAEARVGKLLKEREGAYDFADISINTAQRSMEQAIQRILESLEAGKPE
ncbi:shikimate kinase [Xylanibacillus composti]|uniref:Shikimate kinase n=1 Tax=Xylanibacillus composti TaxID=1572762 RepID=A0A8J4M297_9BACL|nr:shikimate kinase [Xylanibacillus composti]GIQ68301.1 shikimate kinase [Xylanibacillus composti]